MIDELCDSTDTSYSRQRKTRNVNEGVKKVDAFLINADGTWQYDASTHTDQPRATFNLTEGQEPYTFASDYLQIEAMDVRQSAIAPWRRLIPLDHSELREMTPEEYFGVDASGNPTKGIPTHFDMFTDDSFRLYPAPAAASMTLASGARVWFKRNSPLFTVASDTTADSTEPGFALNHEILAYMASIPYCIKYHSDRVPAYLREIEKLKTGIIEHYSHREKMKRKFITMYQRPYR